MVVEISDVVVVAFVVDHHVMDNLVMVVVVEDLIVVVEDVHSFVDVSFVEVSTINNNNSNK